MSMTSVQYIGELEYLFNQNRNDQNALSMSKYMKNHFPFYGIKSPLRRELQRSFISKFLLPDKNNWQEICREMWVCKEREMQYFSMEIAFRMKNFWNKNDIEVFEFLIVNKSWWDTVDYIASNIAGHYFKTFPEEITKVITRWNDSDNIWLNRVAILFQLKYKNETDFSLLKKVIQPHISSKAFFHQKAIGWALRQYGKFEPEMVKNYVEITDLKPLSKREALKHLS